VQTVLQIVFVRDTVYYKDNNLIGDGYTAFDTMKTIPFNNNVLIEVMREDSAVSRADENESLQFGKVVSLSISPYHITASSFGEIDNTFIENVKLMLKPGVIVRWEEFAEGGQTFKEDGKTYALVPWWRIISIEEKTDA